MSRRSLALLALLTSAVLAGAVGALGPPATARAPPQAACGVCTDALDRAAAERGVTVVRGHTEMTVRVAANGSTRWTAHVTLDVGADALRDDTLRRAVVTDALDGARMVAEPTDVTSRVEGETLVVTYRDPGAAEVSAGVVVFTRFHASDPLLPFVAGGEGSPYPGADAITVRAPDGYAVSGSYGAATTTPERVRWRGDRGIDRSTVVAFVPGGALLPGVRATIARLLLGF